VADPHDHATVLFVSFPKDDGSDAGMDRCAAMEMFRLLDLVYTEFDRLVSVDRARAVAFLFIPVSGVLHGSPVFELKYTFCL
jgi:hypothetical protein